MEEGVKWLETVGVERSRTTERQLEIQTHPLEGGEYTNRAVVTEVEKEVIIDVYQPTTTVNKTEIIGKTAKITDKEIM